MWLPMKPCFISMMQKCSTFILGFAGGVLGNVIGYERAAHRCASNAKPCASVSASAELIPSQGVFPIA